MGVTQPLTIGHEVASSLPSEEKKNATKEERHKYDDAEWVDIYLLLVPFPGLLEGKMTMSETYKS